MAFKLTAKSVKERCKPPADGEVTRGGKPVLVRLYWDTEHKGFCVAVTRSGTRTFKVQRDVCGRSVTVTIGRYGAWTVDEARKRARELIVQMDRGVNPNQAAREEAARGVTLREAMEWHVRSMQARKCAQRSIDSISEDLERHMSDWLDRPLTSIKPNDCARRHEKLTERGPYVANGVMRTFRACWNTAARRLDDLPRCPTRGVTFNKEYRRREPIPWDRLPSWKRAVDGIQNPIRRDLQYFILLTGLRSTDAKTVRWEDVDLDAGKLHRPRPKGGEDRAFTVPVAEAVLEILRRRREENRIIYGRDGGWVFPSRSMKGGVTHVQQVKEQRYVGDQKLTTFPSPHRLRDTYASAAHEAGVDPLSLKALMNHVLPSNGDVTAGYIRPSTDHLRAQAEKVAAFLLERMLGGGGRPD